LAKPDDRLERDDHQARADGAAHRESAEQHQRGHDQESAADADQAGEHADAQAFEHHDPGRVLAAGVGSIALAAEHQHRGEAPSREASARAGSAR
jgi:hypothetical protein